MNTQIYCQSCRRNRSAKVIKADGKVKRYWKCNSCGIPSLPIFSGKIAALMPKQTKGKTEQIPT